MSALLTAVSLFSGCGGIDLGFLMALFRTLWANDTSRAARASLCRNFPDAAIDKRPIAEVQVRDILARTGLAVGELGVLFGGWPCQPFSTAGPRSMKWDGVIERLFFEFVRLAAGLRPFVAVGENVIGMAAGASVGWLKIFVRGMESISYRVAVQELSAADYGVAQDRRRLIFICVRRDLPAAFRDPATWFPAPHAARLGVSDVLPWVDTVVGYNRKPFERPADLPLPTMLTDRQWLAGRAADGSVREFTIDELKLLAGFPPDFILAGSEREQRKQIGNAVPPPMAHAIACGLRDVLLAGKEP